MSRAFFAAGLVLLCLAGCNRGSGGGAGDGKSKPLIAVIPKATSHEFWKSVHAGAVEGAKEAGVDIVWKGPITESDREQQINVVQDFITRGVAGICLAPLDSGALIPAVADAARAKIPVLIFDSGLDDPKDAVSFVATDNYHGGQLAAREIGRLLGGKGRLVVLRYMPGSQSTTLREDGCLDTIKREFPEIEVVSSGEYSGDTADKALNKSHQLLLALGDRVDAAFTSTQQASTGMLKALEEQGLAGKVKFIGFDAGPELVAALRRKMHGIVLQDPVGMGRLAVTKLAAYLRGEKIEPRIATGETLATPDNMNEPAIKRLLQPKIEE